MQLVSAAELLDLWERGIHQSLTEKVVSLVAAVCPDVTRDEILRLPLGQRNRILLMLRGTLFGSDLNAVSHCTACGELLEVCFRIADIWHEPATDPQAGWTVECDGYRATFRPATSLDILSLPLLQEREILRSHLLNRCVPTACDPAGQTVSADTLPDAVVTAIANAMAAADPQAEVLLDLSCPVCQHQSRPIFDIAALLVKEIHSWAHRTLRDVDVLARAYGWREIDILALTPTRRQIYLELSGI